MSSRRWRFVWQQLGPGERSWRLDFFLNILD
jgi:hypothetical protein